MQLLTEFKRRNVFRMAGLYLAAAWLVVHVVETVLPLFGVPDWVLRAIIVTLAIGFVPAMVAAAHVASDRRLLAPRRASVPETKAKGCTPAMPVATAPPPLAGRGIASASSNRPKPVIASITSPASATCPPPPS